MNLAIFQGNLVRDMEISERNDLKVARGAVALDRGKDKDGNSRGADFPSIVAFGKRAEFFEKFGKKGRRFTFECHVQTGSYEKDGVKHYTTDFIIDRVEFADSKSTEAQNGTQDAPAVDPNGFMQIPDDIDEELPFN